MSTTATPSRAAALIPGAPGLDRHEWRPQSGADHVHRQRASRLGDRLGGGGAGDVRDRRADGHVHDQRARRQASRRPWTSSSPRPPAATTRTTCRSPRPVPGPERLAQQHRVGDAHRRARRRPRGCIVPKRSRTPPRSSPETVLKDLGCKVRISHQHSKHVRRGEVIKSKPGAGSAPGSDHGQGRGLVRAGQDEAQEARRAGRILSYGAALRQR